MKRQTSVYKVLNIVVLLSAVFGIVPPAMAAPASLVAQPTAPSERASDWPSPELPADPISPFLDSTTPAIKRALGDVVDSDLLDGGLAVLEPLASNPFSFPSASLPGIDFDLFGGDGVARLEPLMPHSPLSTDLLRPSVSLPTPPDPLAEINASLPQPSDLSALTEQAEATGETLDFDGAKEDKTASASATIPNSVDAQPTESEDTPAAVELGFSISDPTQAHTVVENEIVPATERLAPSVALSDTTIYLPIVTASDNASAIDQVTVTPEGGGILNSQDGWVRLEVPQGAVASETVISYRLLPTQTVTGFLSIGPFFELVATDSDGNEVTQFHRDLGLIVNYTEGSEVDENDLALYYSQDGDDWQLVPSIIHTDTNQIVAQLDHFTDFAVLDSLPCNLEDIGKGAPSDVQGRMQAAWQSDYNCPATDAYVVTTLNGVDYYAQEFPNGTPAGAIVDNPNLPQAFFLPNDVWNQYEPMASDLGGPLGSQPSAPRHFIDPGHNFREQEIWNFEYGFVSQNTSAGSAWEAHRYFPQFPQGELTWEPDPTPNSDEYRLVLTTDFHPNPPAYGVTNPVPNAPTAAVQLAIEDPDGNVELTPPVNSGEISGLTIESGYNYYQTQTLKIYVAGTRNGSDDLTGYSPCDHYDPDEDARLYYFLNPPYSRTFEHSCAGNGVPDTTPPRIEIIQIYGTDNKELAPLAVTLLARITDDYGVASQSVTISDGTVVQELEPYPSEYHGPNVYAAIFEDVPEKTLIIFEINATDTSGNAAPTVTAQAWFVDGQLLDLRICGYVNPCDPVYVDEAGNPIVSLTGDKSEVFPLLYVPGPGEADIDVTLTYNSANIRVGMFGAAMASSLETHLVPLYNPLVNGIEVVLGDGGRLRFEDNGDGTFTAASPSSADTLVKDGDSYLFTTRSQQSYRFDADGRLIEQLDRNGNVIAYTYSGDQLTDLSTGGRTVTLTYNGDGYVQTLQIGDKVITLTYDGDRLVGIQDAEGGDWVLEYETHEIGEIIDERGEDFAYVAYNHYLTHLTTPEGRIKNEQTYDSQGRVISQTSSLVGPLTFDYVEHPDGSRESHITDAYGNVESHYYNNLGQLWKKTDRENNDERYFYDDKFYLIRRIDFNGNEWEYKRDVNGNIIEIFGPEGFHEVWKYNRFNRPTYRKDADGYEWSWKYDDWGNLGKTIRPDGSFSEIFYDSRGLPTDIYDFNKNHLRNEHDPLTGDLLRTWDGENSLIRFEYDQYGRLVKTIRPLGNVWEHAYDLNDNLTDVYGPLSYHTEYRYDADDLMTEEKDADGNWMQYIYDEHGRLKEFRNGEDEPTFYRYWPMNELKEVENARGAITTYSYDKNYRVIQIDMPEEVSLSFEYDGLGNVLFATDGEGRVTAYEYDGLSLLKKMTQNYVDEPISDADTNVITRFFYDQRGNLTRTVNSLLDEIEYDYDEVGRLRWVENEEDERTKYEYDDNDNLTRIQYPELNAIETEYNGRNQPRLLRDGEGYETELVYDANGNLKKAIAPDDIIRHYEYNLLDQAITVTDNYIPAGPINHDTNVTTYYQYSLEGDPLLITNAEGYQFSFEYDGAHRRVHEINPEGEIFYTYDDVGNSTKRLDANGHPWRYEYDLLDRLTAFINPEDHTITYGYDRANNLTAVTDARGHTITTVYDALNRPVTVIDRMDYETHLTYDATGNLLALTDGNDHTTEFEYDRAQRLLARIDAEGYRTEYEYDDNGRLTLTRIPFPDPAQTIEDHYEYDGRDLPTHVANGENETTIYAYNSVGLQETMTENDGIVTRYEYDSLHRLSRVTLNYDGTGIVAADRNVAYNYRYDRVGNLVSILDPEGHETSFSYDGLNRLKQEVDAGKNTWDYEYDPVGNRTVRIDANRNRTDYAYYDDDQLERIDYYDGTSVVYTYDENNNRLTMVDHLGTTTWEYDFLDRVTDVTDPFNRHLGYAYDAINRTGLTYPDGRIVVYTYYDNDWLKTVIDPKGNITTYDRDPAGRITRTTNPNDTVTDVTYDRANRVLTLVNRQTTGGHKTNSAFAYTYNEVDHVTQVVNEYGWRNPPVVIEDYTYDKLRRLTGMENSDGVVMSYTYDKAGNRLTWATNDDLTTQTPFDGFSASYEYNEANQLTMAEIDSEKPNGDLTIQFTYDANGNRINKLEIPLHGPSYGTDYTYDPENRLVVAQDYQLVDHDNRIDRAITTLEYDGGGRRLVKTYDPKEGGGGQKRVEYVFDGLDPVAEYNMLNGQRDNYYRGAIGRITTMHHFLAGTQGQMYWYHYNFKGDVMGLTKHQGQSTHNYRYDPYGGVVPAHGNFTDPHSHYTLTGKEYDEHMGLVYFGARHYDPMVGRWVSQDSYRGNHGNPLTLHRYMYVLGNPVSLTDFAGYGLCDWLKENVYKPYIEPVVEPAVECFEAGIESNARYISEVADNLEEGKRLSSFTDVNFHYVLAPVDQWAWQNIPSTIGIKPLGWGSIGGEYLHPVAPPFCAGGEVEGEHMFVFNWRTMQSAWVPSYALKVKAGGGGGGDVSTSAGIVFYYGVSSLDDLGGRDWQFSFDAGGGALGHLGGSIETSYQTAEDGWNVKVDPISKMPIVSEGVSLDGGAGLDAYAVFSMSSPSTNNSSVLFKSKSPFGEGKGLWTDPQYRDDLTDEVYPDFLYTFGINPSSGDKTGGGME